jgi:DNA modification methylase
MDNNVKKGDIWILGNHRLMCGDSIMIDDVEKMMDGKKADMVFTDPPYGVAFKQGQYISIDKRGKNRKFEPIANDDKKGNDHKEFIQLALSNAAIVSNVCSIYVWSPTLLQGAAILQAIIDSGWHVQSQLIWNKSTFVIGRADYHWKHEICWYGYKGKKHQWFGGRNKSTVWDCPKIKSSNLHPTMKPVKLAEIACINSSKTGDIILDLFGGSGSTLIACENLNRHCFMMEILPNYCDIIIKRWEEFTHKKAIKEDRTKIYGYDKRHGNVIG